MPLLEIRLSSAARRSPVSWALNIVTYRSIHNLGKRKKGSADLCAYFFLRAGRCCRYGGMAGLIATNTIAEGDTREVGLDQLRQQIVIIRRASLFCLGRARRSGSYLIHLAKAW